MSYVSNHTADIAIKAKQRAQLDAEYKAYIMQRRPVTVAPGYPDKPAPKQVRPTAPAPEPQKRERRNEAPARVWPRMAEMLELKRMYRVSAAAIARRVGVAHSTMACILSGEYNATASTQAKIEEAILGIVKERQQ
jgi:hypothetical protein